MKFDKRGFLFLALAVSLALNGPLVCYAGDLKNPDGSLSDTKDAAAWEEEYTDTDTEKGTVSFRGKVFEGFCGEVTVHFTRLAGGRSFDVTLNQAGDYMKNLSLTGETYSVTGVTAISGLREYDCYAEPVVVEVTANGVSVCNVYVSPGSVRKFPEETEGQTTRPAAETKTEESGKPMKPEGQAEPEEQAEPPTPEETLEEGQHQGGRPVLGNLGMVLFLICAGSLIYIQKREK